MYNHGMGHITTSGFFRGKMLMYEEKNDWYNHGLERKTMAWGV